MPISLDEIDIQLLRELEQDADRSNVQLCSVVGLSPAATYNRIRRLKDEGVISRIVARVDPAEVGFTLQVYVAETLARHDDVAHRRFAEAVAEMPEVLSADWVTGETDALLWVVARNVTELQRVLLLLSSRGGAQRVMTLLRLEELKARAPLPLVAEEGASPRARRQTSRAPARGTRSRGSSS
jgi:Lrp/AsnC family transcriptional regulator, leucine-responsive regulatory protein